jgi:hypothetical protein
MCGKPAEEFGDVGGAIVCAECLGWYSNKPTPVKFFLAEADKFESCMKIQSEMDGYSAYFSDLNEGMTFLRKCSKQYPAANLSFFDYENNTPGELKISVRIQEN